MTDKRKEADSARMVARGSEGRICRSFSLVLSFFFPLAGLVHAPRSIGRDLLQRLGAASTTSVFATCCRACWSTGHR
jgi:hypothetical protein